MTAEPACKVSHRDKLPAIFAAVADLLGDGPLLALIEAHGGTRLYVPERVAPHDPLAKLLGVKPAQRLTRAYGRDTILVSLCKPWRMTMLRQDGLTYAAIGRRLGMTEQSVERALSARRMEAGPDRAVQLRLWD